jgi:hypothetical protein
MFGKLEHKVGELVTISYETDRIGIVTEVRDNNPFPYRVKWLVEDKMNARCKTYGDYGHYSVGVIISLEEICNIK